MKWAIVKDNKIIKIYSGESSESAYGRLARPPHASHIQVPVNLENETELKYENGEIVVDSVKKIKKDKAIVRKNRIKMGKNIRLLCENILDLLAGFNIERALTKEQIDQMAVTFGNIQALLNVKRPISAKPLIEAIEPDGVLVTHPLDDKLQDLHLAGGKRSKEGCIFLDPPTTKASKLFQEPIADTILI